MATTTKKTTTKNTAKTTEKANKNISENITTEKETVAEPTTETVAETVKDAVREAVKEVVKAIEPVIEPVVENQKKEFTDSDYILCRSVTSGGLNIVSQSGNLYEFKDYGSECEINYRDLVTLIRRGSEHVFLPRLVILDEDFLEDFPTVKKVYGEMYTKEDLIEILDLPSIPLMKREIEKLPEATKNSMRNLIATQIANGRLDSIAKVRALTDIFNSDFNLLSELLVK